MTLETLTSVFGWMSVLGIGFLLVSTVAIFAMQNWAADLHVRMFGLDRETVRQSYFDYLATFKIAVLVPHVIPYLALRIAG